MSLTTILLQEITVQSSFDFLFAALLDRQDMLMEQNVDSDLAKDLAEFQLKEKIGLDRFMEFQKWLDV